MRKLMFPQILRESEHFRAILTLKGFLVTMDVVVSLEREFGSEAFAAAFKLAFVVE